MKSQCRNVTAPLPLNFETAYTCLTSGLRILQPYQHSKEDIRWI